jgi:MFS family permease
MLTTAAACILMASVDLGTMLLVLVMSLSGFMTGALMPSRDMIVRQVTPPGAFGKVFGFVTNGFNIAGMVSPLICGALMDRGEPRAVFLTLAVTAILALITVVSVPRRRAA